ncbi:TPA: hypothetical protein PXN16_002438 [Yersinia enterocolitica]|nr:hypothetical protein [Yersinia enterocolitica]
MKQQVEDNGYLFRGHASFQVHPSLLVLAQSTMSQDQPSLQLTRFGQVPFARFELIRFLVVDE